MLEQLGLRQAYVILMFGAGSWSSFKELHDGKIPETCRLFGNDFLALQNDYYGLVGTGKRSASEDITDELLAEFERARGKNDLRSFYVEQLVKLAYLPVKEPVVDGEQPHWYFAEAQQLCAHKSQDVPQPIRGIWRAMPAQLSVRLTQRRALKVGIVVDSTVPFTDRLVQALLRRAFHPCLFSIREVKKGGVRFDHKLPSNQIWNYGASSGGVLLLNEDGQTKLRDILASLGVTEVTM